MVLNDFWVRGLAQDFKQVIIANEVEARELLSLFLKIVVEGFLAHLELSEDSFERVFKTWDFD